MFSSEKGRWWAEHVVNLRGHILIEFAGATCEPHGALNGEFITARRQSNIYFQRINIVAQV